MIRAHDLHGFLERVAVAVDETVENDRHRAELFSHRRWTPAAPALHQKIQRQPFDDRGEKRPPGAAILEFSQRRTVVLQQLDVDVALEILQLHVRQVMAPA